MDVLDIARFWSKVDVGHQSERWCWRGPCTADGYPEFKLDGASQAAKRVAFRMAFGDIPDGAVIRHTCDNPACVNPRHLLSGTHADNVRDRVIRNRSARGEAAGRAILTEDAVRAIRASGLPASALASRYGVSIHTIYAVNQRMSWKHVE